MAHDRSRPTAAHASAMASASDLIGGSWIRIGGGNRLNAETMPLRNGDEAMALSRRFNMGPVRSPDS